MSEEIKGGYCNDCEQRNVVFRQGTSHILHLLMTVITCGFWAIIWLGSCIKFGGWRCKQCGSSSVSKIK